MPLLRLSSGYHYLRHSSVPDKLKDALSGSVQFTLLKRAKLNLGLLGT
jgi:hypothetical protein